MVCGSISCLTFHCGHSSVWRSGRNIAPQLQRWYQTSSKKKTSRHSGHTFRYREWPDNDELDRDDPTNVWVADGRTNKSRRKSALANYIKQREPEAQVEGGRQRALILHRHLTSPNITVPQFSGFGNNSLNFNVTCDTGRKKRVTYRNASSGKKSIYIVHLGTIKAREYWNESVGYCAPTLHHLVKRLKQRAKGEMTAQHRNGRNRSSNNMFSCWTSMYP